MIGRVSYVLIRPHCVTGRRIENWAQRGSEGGEDSKVDENVKRNEKRIGIMGKEEVKQSVKEIECGRVLEQVPRSSLSARCRGRPCSDTASSQCGDPLQ